MDLHYGRPCTHKEAQDAECECLFVCCFRYTKGGSLDGHYSGLSPNPHGPGLMAPALTSLHLGPWAPSHDGQPHGHQPGPPGCGGKAKGKYSHDQQNSPPRIFLDFFGSDRSPRRGNLGSPSVRLSVYFIEYSVEKASKHCKQASKQASKQSSKQASKQASRQASN